MRKKELIFDEKSKSNFAKGTKKSGDGPGDDGELESAVMYKIHCAVYVVQCTSCLVVEYQTYWPYLVPSMCSDSVCLTKAGRANS